MNCFMGYYVDWHQKYFLHSQMTSCAMRYDIIYRGGLTALPLPAWLKGNGDRCYAGCRADIIYICIYYKFSQDFYLCQRFFCPPPCVYLVGERWQYRQSKSQHEEEGISQPVAFIGIGSKNEQEMQQLIIEDKVREL